MGTEGRETLKVHLCSPGLRPHIYILPPPYDSWLQWEHAFLPRTGINTYLNVKVFLKVPYLYNAKPKLVCIWVLLNCADLKQSSMMRAPSTRLSLLLPVSFSLSGVDQRILYHFTTNSPSNESLSSQQLPRSVHHMFHSCPLYTEKRDNSPDFGEEFSNSPHQSRDQCLVANITVKGLVATISWIWSTWMNTLLVLQPLVRIFGLVWLISVRVR